MGPSQTRMVELFSGTKKSLTIFGKLFPINIWQVSKYADPTRRGFFWIRPFKTYYPLGLNIEEEL